MFRYWIDVFFSSVSWGFLGTFVIYVFIIYIHYSRNVWSIINNEILLDGSIASFFVYEENKSTMHDKQWWGEEKKVWSLFITWPIDYCPQIFFAQKRPDSFQIKQSLWKCTIKQSHTSNTRLKQMFWINKATKIRIRL
jgi:hypothetical protein